MIAVVFMVVLLNVPSNSHNIDKLMHVLEPRVGDMFKAGDTLTISWEMDVEVEGEKVATEISPFRKVGRGVAFHFPVRTEIKDGILDFSILRNEQSIGRSGVPFLNWFIVYPVGHGTKCESMLPISNETFVAYPNPFNPVCKVNYSLPVSGYTTISVYDLSGKLIKKLMSDVVAAGKHEVVWDATDMQGNKVACGMYVYRLTCGGRDIRLKVVMAK